MVYLRGGIVVPVAAYVAVLDLERAGHRLELDGDDIIVFPAKASYPIDPDMLAALKRWKRHAIMLLHYTADDSHLHDRDRESVSYGAAGQ
jgi:hypothetical protein